ncbi:efflux RND transporter periplasmic adaptor subunit [Microbulbifer guangxiensis]|uniref:efflux RND transporter periplasmic adaptor subunit n=1 Tax=Microbulbifer guangxiensis TaxID=2904249 RepID=UPI001F385BB2|nr:HlyD family efflux transporter periplasmic adaptor subunit [Microbulbifer guangxiensis]
MHRKLLRRIVAGALLGVLMAFFVYAYLPKPVPVDLAKVSRGPLEVYVRDEGYTRVHDVYVVSAPVTGYLLRIDRDVGDTVEANKTLIAQLLPTSPGFLDKRGRTQALAAIQSAEAALNLARAERRDAEARLAFALADARRIRTLAKKNYVSQSELERTELALDSAEASVDTAKAAERARAGEVDSARAQLIAPEPDGSADPEDIVPVTAPVSGRVLRLQQESERVVIAGTPLVEIGNAAELEVVVDLLSRDAVQVEPGAPAEFTSWGGDKPLTGRVRLVEPFGFTKISALGIEEQRVNVIIDFTEPRQRWSRLGHGYRVDAAIRIWRGEDVLQVPTGALFRHRGEWAVFRLRGDRAERVVVKLGQNNGLQAEVLEGLQEGETLVLHPSERISEGVLIEERRQ